MLREFADDCRQPARLQRLFHRPQPIARGCGAHDKQPRGVEPEIIAAQPVKRARFEGGEILLHEDNGAATKGSGQRQRQREAQSRTGMRWSRRHDLMQFREREPAPEDPVRST